MGKRVKGMGNKAPRHGMWGAKKNLDKLLSKGIRSADQHNKECARVRWVKLLEDVTDPLMRAILERASVDYFAVDGTFAITFPQSLAFASEMLKKSFEDWSRPLQNVHGVNKIAVMFKDSEDV